jgi:hypothetical protein
MNGADYSTGGKKNNDNQRLDRHFAALRARSFHREILSKSDLCIDISDLTACRFHDTFPFIVARLRIPEERP